MSYSQFGGSQWNPSRFIGQPSSQYGNARGYGQDFGNAQFGGQSPFFGEMAGGSRLGGFGQLSGFQGEQNLFDAPMQAGGFGRLGGFGGHPAPPSPADLLAKLDTDSSGSISLAEFKADKGPGGFAPPDAMKEKFFAKLDADGDGSVTQAELEAAPPPPPPHGRPRGPQFSSRSGRGFAPFNFAEPQQQASQSTYAYGGNGPQLDMNVLKNLLTQLQGLFHV